MRMSSYWYTNEAAEYIYEFVVACKYVGKVNFNLADKILSERQIHFSPCSRTYFYLL